MSHQIAQFNVAKLRAPLTDPLVADFVDALEPINALADGHSGFVWRLQTDEGDATTIRIYEDELVIVNMSIWEDIESLRAFVYSSDHRFFLARRKEWFEPLASEHLVLWWVGSRSFPEPAEGARRLEHLRENGPTPNAFTLRRTFPPPLIRPGPSVRAQ